MVGSAGGGQLPDMFSPAATPASIRYSRDPDNEIDFFGTNMGLVEDYSSESATSASDDEEEDSRAAAGPAYVMSLEQQNESLKQENLNLREVPISITS